MDLVTVSLGTFVLAEITKYLLPVRLLPAAKLLVVLVFAFAGALLVSLPDIAWKPFVALASSGAGGAALLHAGHKFVSAAGDERRVATLGSRGRTR